MEDMSFEHDQNPLSEDYVNMKCRFLTLHPPQGQHFNTFFEVEAFLFYTCFKQIVGPGLLCLIAATPMAIVMFIYNTNNIVNS